MKDHPDRELRVRYGSLARRRDCGGPSIDEVRRDLDYARKMHLAAMLAS